MPKKRKTIWQRHHITYEPEWVVPVTKGEHFILTRLQWLKSVSDGFKTALLHELNTKPKREDATQGEESKDSA